MGLLSLFKSKPAATGAVAALDDSGLDDDASASATRATETYRKSEFLFFPAGDDQHLVALRDAKHLALPSFVVDFALNCDTFLPLQQHLANHAELHHLSGLQVDALTAWLPRIIEAGVLISSEQIRARCAAMIDPANRPSPVGLIGFPTGGQRLTMLERCLTSFGANLRTHERTADFLVADSSTSPEQSAAFRTLLQRLKREQGLPLRYMGEEEKRLFARALVERSGCRPSSVEFALFDPLGAGFTCGANRNAILLHEAGRMVATVDDDVICEMAPIPSSKSRVTLFWRGDPCFRSFFPDRESALEAAEFEEMDFLGLHESMLGQDIGALFPADLKATEIDLSSTDDDFLRRVKGESARIRTTYFGQLGDPGTPTSCYYLYLTGKNLTRLTTSEELYCAAFANRSVLSGVPNPAIGGGYLSPGMTIGMDHRNLLPPFFPVLHAEDMIFAAASSLCCFQSFAGHLPIALHHDSGKNKVLHQPEDLGPENRVAVFEFATIVRSILFGCAPPELADDAERMRTLGRNLSTFAAPTRSDYLEAFRHVVLRIEADELSFLEDVLRRESDAPDYWRRDIEHFIAHSRLALEHDDFDIPFDLKGQRPNDENRRLMQRLLASYGELLEDWPDIVAAARELRESGQVFSTEVSAG